MSYEPNHGVLSVLSWSFVHRFLSNVASLITELTAIFTACVMLISAVRKLHNGMKRRPKPINSVTLETNPKIGWKVEKIK